MIEPTPSGGGGEAPSGADPGIGGPQPPCPLLTNLRAEREWLWLKARFSEARLSEAIQALGTQRPYPLNIARRLQVELPPEEDLPFTLAQRNSSRSSARASLDASLALLRKKSKSDVPKG
jgi:hypothetical protein